MNKSLRSSALVVVLCLSASAFLPSVAIAQAAPPPASPQSTQSVQDQLKKEEQANKQQAKAEKDKRKALKQQDKAAKAAKKAGTAAPAAMQ